MSARALSVLLGGISFLSLPGTRGLISPHPITPRRHPASSWHGSSGDSTTNGILCSNSASSAPDEEDEEERPHRQALPRRRRSTTALFSTKQDQHPPRRPVPKFAIRSVDAPPARRAAARSDQFSRPRPVGRTSGAQEQQAGGGRTSAGGGAAVATREAARGRVGEAGSRGLSSAMQSLRDCVEELPRLSREEETELGNHVQRWQLLERLRREVSRAEAGCKGEVGVEAWATAAGISVTDLRELVETGVGAREKLVLSHVRLVIYLARRRGRATALSPMDLVQEGAMALHVAVDRYDPSRGVRFCTYADWALRAAFEQSEADQTGAFRLPRYVYVQKRRLKAVVTHETALRHRPPTRQELATALDVTEGQLARLQTWADGADSTDRTLICGATLGEVAHEPQRREEHLQRLDAEATLGRLLRHLNPQEAQVILHRYGLFGRGRKSTLAVAALMGVSRQYVGRVHQAALVKMRSSLDSGSGDDFNPHHRRRQQRGQSSAILEGAGEKQCSGLIR